MSRRLYQSDWRDAYSLGSIVEFDYYGDRLRGKVVRVSSNPDYLHVEVDGTRYAVSINQDNASMVWEE